MKCGLGATTNTKYISKASLAQARLVGFIESVQAMPLLPSSRWRLRVKTTVQGAVIGADLGMEGDATKSKSIYLVTLSHPKAARSACGKVLLAPENFTREEVLGKFLASCASPVYMDARSIRAAQPMPIKFVCVFREVHKEDADGIAHGHYHIGVVAFRQFMFLPVKRALLNFGLASHWSNSHDGYWSIVRYLWWPSPPKKPDCSIDKQAITWAAPGCNHLSFDECCTEPLTAKAIGAKRLKVDRRAAEDGKAEPPRITEMDVWPIVVKHNIRDTPDDATAHSQLKAWAKDHATEAMQKFLFKNRSRIPGLIEDIWEWELVEKNLPMARMGRMDTLKAAVEAGCKCGGQWAKIVKTSFDDNKIDVEALCSDILSAMQKGRSVSTPVIVLAGKVGGEGKSVFLKALLSVFGAHHVFLTPDKTNFPFLGLHGKKVVFLDEWRFNDAIISFPSQMQWFEGSHLTVSRPQNIQGTSGHMRYEGTAPIFATTKAADLKLLEELAQIDAATGLPRNAEASMMMRRLRVYHFNTRIAKPEQDAPFCACCFAKLVLGRGVPSQHGLWEAEQTYFL